MKQIEDCTKELLLAITNSYEYRRFCELRDTVRREPGLREQINDFRKKVYEVQNSCEVPDAYGAQEQLCREYREFRKNPLVSDFLQAELRVCRMVQQITQEIAGGVDLDTREITEGIEL